MMIMIIMMMMKTNLSSWREFANKDEFSMVLSDFLFSSYGARYKIRYYLYCSDMIRYYTVL